MKFNITGRHVVVTNALREYAEQRIQKSLRYSAEPVNVDVILSVERNRHQAELLVRINGRRILAKEETHEMYQSIDKAAASVERRLRKYKEKKISHDRDHRAEDRSAVPPSDEIGEWAVHRRPPRRVRALGFDDAVRTLVAGKDPQLLFVDESDGKLKILERRPGRRVEVREIVAD